MATDDQYPVMFETRAGVVVGTILGSGVVEAGSVGAFGKYLVEHVERHPGIKLLLNFGQVEYMSSSTLTELIKVKEKLEAGGGSLGICGLRKDVLRVFQITNLEKHMNVIADADISDAVHRFASGKG